MSQVIEPASADQVRTILSGSVTPVLIDFFAHWCGPCKALAPVLDDFAAERAGALSVLKIDVDRFAEIAGLAGIRSVPTLMIVKDGRVLGTRAGSMPKQALATFVDQALA